MSNSSVVKAVTKEADGTFTLHLQNGHVSYLYTFWNNTYCSDYCLLTLFAIVSSSFLCVLPLLQTLEGFDCLLRATGRHPKTAQLNLQSAGVATTGPEAYVQVCMLVLAY